MTSTLTPDVWLWLIGVTALGIVVGLGLAKAAHILDQRTEEIDTETRSIEDRLVAARGMCARLEHQLIEQKLKETMK